MTSLPMTFLLEWTTRQRGGGKMRDSERRTESTRQRGLSTRQRGGVTKRDSRETFGRNVGTLDEESWRTSSTYSRIFWTYKLTVGVTDVKAKTRHVCRDSTWYMTPQRTAGETPKTLDVQLGFGRDRKPKRRATTWTKNYGCIATAKQE